MTSSHLNKNSDVTTCVLAKSHDVKRMWQNNVLEAVLRPNWSVKSLMCISMHLFCRVTCTRDQRHTPLRLVVFFLPLHFVSGGWPGLMYYFCYLYPSGLQSDRAGGEDQCSESSVDEESDWIWAWIRDRGPNVTNNQNPSVKCIRHVSNNSPQNSWFQNKHFMCSFFRRHQDGEYSLKWFVNNWNVISV